MKMTSVEKCQASQCAYNSDGSCHALAITIGDPGGPPRCDTFFENEVKGGDEQSHAGIGACKMTNCMYNSKLECTADAVSVGEEDQDVDCLTFCPQ